MIRRLDVGGRLELPTGREDWGQACWICCSATRQSVARSMRATLDRRKCAGSQAGSWQTSMANLQ